MNYYNEEWVDIEGYEGYYQVSNMGRVRSVNRHIQRSDGRLEFRKQQIILGYIDKDGYCRVSLRKGRGNPHGYQVHRLVALHFIENPNNLPQINHIDENKENNCATNLEWCDCKYNINYGNHNKKVSKTNFNHINIIPIKQYGKDGTFIKEWISAANASRELNIGAGEISKCCKRKQETAGGFIWRYADDDTEVTPIGKRVFSEEHKRHMSESRKGKRTGKESPVSKPVIQYTMDGDFVAEYDCISEAARVMGFASGGHIASVCRGRRKHAGGFIWRYKNLIDSDMYKKG